MFSRNEGKKLVKSQTDSTSSHIITVDSFYVPGLDDTLCHNLKKCALLMSKPVKRNERQGCISKLIKDFSLVKKLENIIDEGKVDDDTDEKTSSTFTLILCFGCVVHCSQQPTSIE
ncbi:uncharacterized protein EV154DRAFT_477220 [Mucor mucedo]|uniref:uncharacterized protein n=1 Tax=Mucor mucedo TaxID=29922 RepID=UPI00221FA05F|nr:uncharacterized protein EV154DRAFT_477220 [Mucor mucedo]KAI7895771.1 hypothetical protein EV154DRAFT_477220 [Mucor mucedo]